MAVDADGSIVIAGDVYGTLDLGGGLLTSAGDADLFIARLNADGTHRWSRRFGDAAGQHCRELVMAPNGGTVITGFVGGSVDFGGGPLTAVDDHDVFIASFDRDGAHLGSRVFAHGENQSGRDVAVDADGNVVLAGNFYNRVDPGGGELVSSGGQDIFLAKYDPAGNHLWSQRFGGLGIDESANIGMDAAGSLVMTGWFVGAIDLGGGILNSAGGQDIFVARWDAAGDPLWSRRYGDRNSQLVYGLACGTDGSIALTGSFEGTINLGGADLVASPGTLGSLIAVLDADGGHRWSVTLPQPANLAWVLTAAFSGTHLLSGGHLIGSMDLPGYHLVSRGLTDALLLEFDESGNVADASVHGGDGAERVNALATDDAGVVAAGSYVGPSNLGGDDLPVGRDDFFVVSYSHEDPDYTPILAFSAVPGAGRVEIRWVFSFEDPSPTYRLMRNVDGDSLWTTLSEGAAAPGSSGYDDSAASPGHTYAYQLGLTVEGREFLSRVITVTVPSSALSLMQNAPNPFLGVTTIHYSLSDGGPVVIQIYDAAGRRIARLDQGARLAGAHQAVWNGQDDSGNPVASGVYFYRLEGMPAAGARKMLLLTR